MTREGASMTLLVLPSMTVRSPNAERPVRRVERQMEWVAGLACDEAVRDLQVVPWHGVHVSYGGRECLDEKSEKSEKSERRMEGRK